MKLSIENSLPRNIPNLTSPSPNANLPIEIMSTVDGKLSFIEREDCSRETFEVIKKVQSEMVQNAIEDELMYGEDGEGNESEGGRNKCNPCEKDCEHSTVSAEKVLLKTDLCCLEQERDEVLKNAGKPQDFFPELLEQEKSVFEKLPDGSEIIRGTKKMFELPLERKIYNYENLSVLVGISALVTSTKYSIGSWTPETVDYVTACACIMSGAVKLNSQMDFYTYEKHQLPKIHVRNKFYSLKMAAVQNGMWCHLEKILGKVFKTLDRFVVITTRGSFAVFSRQEFYYFFEYSTCNVVGFRIRNNELGASCFLRFPDIHSLVRRIYANHKDVHDQQKFLISQVIAERIKEPCENDEYVPFSASQEQEIVDQLRLNQMMHRDQTIRKVRAVNAKICAEKQRIKKYRDETGKMVLENIDVDCLPAGSFDTTAFFNEDDFRLDRSSLIRSQELMRSAPLHEEYQVDDCIGFQVCDDGTLRIQGSFALCDQNSRDDLKACHFTGVFAIMYAVHHPVESMNFRSVDIILENGKRIWNKVDTDDYRKTRTLRDFVIDATSYELITVEFCSKKINLDDCSSEEDVKMYLKEFFSHQKYGLIKAKCCCLVVIKECDCFYLFDSYVENSETAVAAWYKLEDFESLFCYLLTWKCPNPNLVSDIQVQYVKVLSYKTIKPPKAGYFLFNIPSNPSPSNQKSCHVVQQDEDEKIEWICSTKTIPWSRLEMRNAMNVDRYLSASKWKEFDVEMDNKLF